jgi:CDGSH-type Zn-finger protein
VGPDDVGNEPTIHVTRDGPYRVSGGVPLVRTAQVETEFGEPIGWAADAPLDVGSMYELCRCGRSSTKPFCDGTHLVKPFGGEETADRGPRADRVRTFVGEGVVMTDDRTLCEHAGHCGDRFTDVWRMIRDTADPAVRERLQRMVSLCPSGSLEYAADIESPSVEPELQPSVAVVRDGPLWVRGGIPIEAADGSTYEVRNRVTLCRCGRSGNKPFCDGSHKHADFHDG